METIKEDEWIKKFKEVDGFQFFTEEHLNKIAIACFSIAQQYAASIQGSSGEV